MKLKSKDEIVVKLVEELEINTNREYPDKTGIEMLKWVLSIEESKELDSDIDKFFNPNTWDKNKIDEITEQVKEELLKQNNKES